MKKLDYNDYSLCKLQGKVFEESLENISSSSPIFIRRFMNSKIALSFDNKSILVTSMDFKNIFDLINEEYGISSYGNKKYDKNELYWIGYIYRVLAIYYNKSSKSIFKMFPANEIIKYYYIYHTFDPEYAAERMMENIGYTEDFDKKGLELLKKYTKFDELDK